MDERMIKLECFFGHIELLEEYRWVGTKIVCYSGSISYDQHRVVREKKPLTPLSAMDLQGMKLSEAMLLGMSCRTKGQPTVRPQTFLQKLFRMEPVLCPTACQGHG